jgi:hypothetical protein
MKKYSNTVEILGIAPENKTHFLYIFYGFIFTGHPTVMSLVA